MSGEKVSYNVADSPEEVTPPQTSSMAESGVDIAYERKIIRKVDFRLLPILAALYSISIVDRINIGSAAVAGMTVDLGLNIGSRYSIVLMVFFIPYIIFELPSNLVLRRVGPAVWLSSIAFSWGVVTIGQGFIEDWRTLVLCRVLSGFFEAGFLPGCIYLICSWYMRYEVQQRLAGFYFFTNLITAFSQVLAYGLMQMNGIQGLAGWRWIFIIEGLITVAIAFLAYIFVIDFPDKLLQRSKPFLTVSEVEIIKSRINRDRDDSQADPITWRIVVRHLSDWKLWIYALMFMNLGVPGYALAYFLPTILKGMGYSIGMSLLMSALPAIPGVVVCLGFGWWADKSRLRAPFIALGTLFIIAGLSMTAYSSHHRVRYFGVCLCTAGQLSNVPTLFAYQSNNIRMDSKRSVSSALLIGTGSIGGIFASNVFRAKDAPGYRNGFWAAIGCQFLNLLLLACMTVYFKRKNRQHKEGTLDKPLENHPEFTYTI